ncbi:MAG: hypothetical protein DCF30_16240 [Hyphomicrobiales bacterium]|nr:MAG: hypothetical protein DCF30_16240 [Hyphomicrobiales bacterium]
MHIKLSETLRREVEATVRTKLSESRIVDVYATAEEIKRHHAAERVTLDDIAVSVANLATQRGCVVQFGHNRNDSAAPQS